MTNFNQNKNQEIIPNEEKEFFLSKKKEKEHGLEKEKRREEANGHVIPVGEQWETKTTTTYVWHNIE